MSFNYKKRNVNKFQYMYQFSDGFYLIIEIKVSTNKTSKKLCINKCHFFLLFGRKSPVYFYLNLNRHYVLKMCLLNIAH